MNTSLQHKKGRDCLYVCSRCQDLLSRHPSFKCTKCKKINILKSTHSHFSDGTHGLPGVHSIVTRTAVFSSARNVVLAIPVMLAFYMAASIFLGKSAISTPQSCPTSLHLPWRPDVNVNFMKRCLSDLPNLFFWIALGAFGALVAYRKRGSGTNEVFFVVGAAIAGCCTALSFAANLDNLGHVQLFRFNPGVVLTVLAAYGFMVLASEVRAAWYANVKA